MSWVIYFLIVLATFVAMEGVAWLTHKYVMHNWLWYLHKDHHVKEPGFFEKNDAFFLIFAIPSMLLILFGTTKPNYYMVCIGAGIALYGLAYFIVHDIIIHQRFKILSRSNNKYVRVVRWAHKMHHKHLDKEHGESFGMLLVARRYWQKVINDDQRFKAQKATN
ncbi:MAG: beta-carotene hydroxylase [Segetibacter sp.]|nr:beta-carotene hydroxylase [Segetibacter sp.]